MGFRVVGVVRELPRRLAAGARRLQEGSGAPHVIVSQAAAPVLAQLEDRLVEVAGPRFQTRDHRGVGDSMTAGLAVGCVQGLALEAVLRLAAAGTLTVTRHGLGDGRRGSIEAIARRIELGPLSR